MGIWRSRIMYYWKPGNSKRLQSFYHSFINEGDLCFDIGAHLGNRTAAWRKLGAKVVAVEPQPACLSFLHKKFANDSAVTILAKGVGETAGKAILHISEKAPTVSTFADAEWRKMIDHASGFEVKWEEQITVEMTTLDHLIEQYGLPAFCKIDVEDYELAVLNGLSHPIPALSIEYFAKTLDKTIDCIHRLETIGKYSYNWSYGESQQMNEQKWLQAEELIQIFQSYDPSDRSGDVYAKLNSQNKYV